MSGPNQGSRTGSQPASRPTAHAYPVSGSAPSWAGRRVGIGAALGRVALVLAIAFGGLAAGAGYWQVIESANLSTSGDDAAVIAAARNVLRGEIFDRDGERLAWNKRDENDEPYRVYASNSLAHVIGYSSRQYGTAGLENAWNGQISGAISADPLRELTRKFRAEPSDPQDLKTTLVLALQQAAVEALGKNRGAVVMLDPRTGEVLALASTPTFDASDIANPATATSTFDRLRADDRLPLLPRATRGLYVPGSVFKIVTSIAALGGGAVTPDTTYEDQPESEDDGWLVDGFRVTDGHHSVTGNRALDFAEAIEASCNIWFAETGVRTGGDALAEWAGRLGFGAALPFDLPTAVSQVTNGGGSFGGGFADRVELANAAYGQAETLVTPLQMAMVASTIANDGELMRPFLVLEATGKAGTATFSGQTFQRVIAPGIASEIGAAMRLAVSGEIGRVFTAGAAVRGLAVAGKSGTAELDVRAAALVVHRVRAVRRPAGCDRRPRRELRRRVGQGLAHRRRPAPRLARLARRMSHGRQANGGDGGPATEPAMDQSVEPATGGDRSPRPMIERVGLGAIALVLAVSFGAIAIAALAGGELFLGVMAGAGALMTLWAAGVSVLRG